MVKGRGAEFVNEVSVATFSYFTFLKKMNGKDKEQDKCVLQMLETYVTRLLYQKHMLRENYDYIGMTKTWLNQAINWDI